MQLFFKPGLGKTVALCGLLLASCCASAIAQATNHPTRGRQLLALLSESAHQRLNALMPSLGSNTYDLVLAELRPDSAAYINKSVQFQHDSAFFRTAYPLRYDIIEKEYNAVSLNLRNNYDNRISRLEQKYNPSNQSPSSVIGAGQVPVTPNLTKKAAPGPHLSPPATNISTGPTAIDSSPSPNRNSSAPVKKHRSSREKHTDAIRQSVPETRKPSAVDFAYKRNTIPMFRHDLLL